MMTEVFVQLKTGKIHLQFTMLEGDKVVFVHFQPSSFSLSAYKEWKFYFDEVLTLAALLGADEVLSIVPKNNTQAANLQSKFGFEQIGETSLGTLTRCKAYGD